MRVLALADEADKRLWDHLDRSLLEGVDLILSAGDLPADYLSFLTCFTGENSHQKREQNLITF